MARTIPLLIAEAETLVGGELQVVLADYFALATEVTDFAGGLIERVADHPGDARALHVGLIILARIVSELQACMHLIRLGYSAQAVSLAATMLELMHVGAYVGSDEKLADGWLSWKNPNAPFPGRISDTIAAVAKRFDVPKSAQLRDYNEVYRTACAVKHANPMAMGATNLAVTQEAVFIVAGPIRTVASARLAHAAMQWAVRYTMLCALAFIADHLTEEEAQPLVPIANDLRARHEVLSAAMIREFPPSDAASSA